MPLAEKSLLSVLKGKKAEKTPVWLMRQAGRYLPEYRALRAEKGGFLDLATDPDSAAEITLQPIRRFGFDGAILFSDILIVPFALGQNLYVGRSEEHTSELQSRFDLVCRLLLEKKKTTEECKYSQTWFLRRAPLRRRARR